MLSIRNRVTRIYINKVKKNISGENISKLLTLCEAINEATPTEKLYMYSICRMVSPVYGLGIHFKHNVDGVKLLDFNKYVTFSKSKKHTEKKRTKNNVRS